MEEKKNKNRPWQIAVSILIAIAVWIFMEVEVNPSVTKKIRNIPVEFSGESTTLADRNLMLTSGYDASVDLVVKGPRRVLWQLDSSNIRLVADTAAVRDTGTQTLKYSVIFPNTVREQEVSVDSASAYAVTVTVGELYTKEIPVYCDIVGQVADGYIGEAVQLDPAVLVLRAQRDDLLNVSYAKVSADISNVSKTVISTSEYTLYDYNDVPVTNENIRANTKLVQIVMQVKTVKEVPLELKYVEAVGSTRNTMSCTIVPSAVKLTGEKEALEGIGSIVLDTIYLQDLQDSQTLEYEIPAPEGTELPEGVRKAVVTIVVTGVSEKKIRSTQPIEVANVMEGLTALVVTERLDVTLRGLSAEMESITGQDFTITADLSGVTTPGSYTVPATITIGDYQNIGVKGTYQVIVNVSEAAVPEPQTPENTTPPDNTPPTNAG